MPHSCPTKLGSLLAVSLALFSGCKSGEFFWNWNPRACYRNSAEVAAGACYDDQEEQFAVRKEMTNHWGPATGLEDAVPSFGYRFSSKDESNEQPQGIFQFQ